MAMETEFENAATTHKTLDYDCKGTLARIATTHKTLDYDWITFKINAKHVLHQQYNAQLPHILLTQIRNPVLHIQV